MDKLNKTRQVVGIGLRKDSVPKVEDVAWPIARSTEDVTSTLSNSFERSEQGRWVEVALDAPVVADTCPRLVQGDAPVNAEEVSSRTGHPLQKGGCPGPEVDRGYAEFLQGRQNTP